MLTFCKWHPVITGFWATRQTWMKTTFRLIFCLIFHFIHNNIARFSKYRTQDVTRFERLWEETEKTFFQFFDAKFLVGGHTKQRDKQTNKKMTLSTNFVLWWVDMHAINVRVWREFFVSVLLGRKHLPLLVNRSLQIHFCSWELIYSRIEK